MPSKQPMITVESAIKLIEALRVFADVATILEQKMLIIPDKHIDTLVNQLKSTQYKDTK